MLVGYAHCHQSIIAKSVPSIDYMRFLVYRTERKVLFIAPPAEPCQAMPGHAMPCDAPLARPCLYGFADREHAERGVWIDARLTLRANCRGSQARWPRIQV